MTTDGSYYSEGRTIFKAPQVTGKDNNSSSMTLGFPICEVGDWLTDADEVAKWIAEVLTEDHLKDKKDE